MLISAHRHGLPCPAQPSREVALCWVLPATWGPHLAFDRLNVLLQTLDQLVHFQDFVLPVA